MELLAMSADPANHLSRQPNAPIGEAVVCRPLKTGEVPCMDRAQCRNQALVGCVALGADHQKRCRSQLRSQSLRVPLVGVGFHFSSESLSALRLNRCAGGGHLFDLGTSGGVEGGVSLHPVAVGAHVPEVEDCSA